MPVAQNGPPQMVAGTDYHFVRGVCNRRKYFVHQRRQDKKDADQGVNDSEKGDNADTAQKRVVGQCQHAEAD
ncbi:MAG: hypothetical protein BWX55_01615 [Deltaproteobacteria bacterium ADurb.Bin022]|nr:MAG: hypothetical protein BWX55_01615 [Deltaproteobacteria bacterium ADurb.Bin022]